MKRFGGIFPLLTVKAIWGKVDHSCCLIIPLLLSQIFNSPNEFQRSSQTPLPSQVSVDALALSNPFPPNYRLEINGTILDLSAFYRPLSTAASLIRTLNSTRQSSLVPTTFQSSPLTTYSLIETSACHVILFNFGLLFGSNLILYILHV